MQLFHATNLVSRIENNTAVMRFALCSKVEVLGTLQGRHYADITLGRN